MKSVILGLILSSVQFLTPNLLADGLNLDNSDNTPQSLNFELNGYLRGTTYMGKTPHHNEAELKSGYGESSLKLRIRNADRGDGYAEIRFRKGTEFNQSVAQINLREAYVNAHMGRCDLGIGHQIIAWGRADGINPTDNITPKNMITRSPDEDDRREGNFLIRSFYNIHPLRLEAIWIPAYAPSVLPLTIIKLPPGISLENAMIPAASIKNSAFGLKLQLEFSTFDGSVSFFNGYNPLPGIAMSQPQVTQTGIVFSIMPSPYKLRIVGADFSTALGAYGLRGEFAYRKPEQNPEKQIHIPNPDCQYILGMDREIGNLSLIIQYLGRYVIDFKRLVEPANPAALAQYEVRLKNRIFSSQINKVTHGISFRPAWKLLHETLTLEFAGMYTFTTDELFLKSRLAFPITDALTLTLGGEFYSGADNTLFGTLDEIMSAIFVELRTQF